MERFENNVIKGVHASRYIISWLRVGGELGFSYPSNVPFRGWLKSLGLTQEERDHIEFLATNGKMELESQARDFIVNLEKRYENIYTKEVAKVVGEETKLYEKDN